MSAFLTLLGNNTPRDFPRPWTLPSWSHWPHFLSSLVSSLPTPAPRASDCFLPQVKLFPLCHSLLFIGQMFVFLCQYALTVVSSHHDILFSRLPGRERPTMPRLFNLILLCAALSAVVLTAPVPGNNPEGPRGQANGLRRENLPPGLQRQFDDLPTEQARANVRRLCVRVCVCVCVCVCVWYLSVSKVLVLAPNC
jgi:hypothetical protein